MVPLQLNEPYHNVFQGIWAFNYLWNSRISNNGGEGQAEYHQADGVKERSFLSFDSSVQGP